jgi:nucleoside-diphosphate-sugar epimerase
MDEPVSPLAALRAAVPPGRAVLDQDELALLRRLTRRLAAARPAARGEFDRFQSIRDRCFDLPPGELADWIGGARVLVTGGTGCIGSLLAEKLAGLGPRRLVSLSRGTTPPARVLPQVEYRTVDIRDRRRLEEVFDEVRPEIVFHVAAQRSPARAEVEVLRTVGTNVFGTRNVLSVATEYGVPDVVCASTGKALRPYSPDVYAASKRAAEWLIARAAGSAPGRFTATRFTHVADNSIVVDRIRRWCKDGVIRLHSPDINFYVQSARESVQLLLAAGLNGRAGRLRIHALRDLGWPVNLLDLALGMIAETGSDAPVYLAGYERGYEEIPFPGLYDPRTAGDVSPLINAFEAAGTLPGRCPEVDVFEAPAPRGDLAVLDRLATLEEVCLQGGRARGGGRPVDEDAVRAALDALSWNLLDVTLSDVPPAQLTRSARLVSACGEEALEPAHRRVLDALRRAADPPERGAARRETVGAP